MNLKEDFEGNRSGRKQTGFVALCVTKCRLRYIVMPRNETTSFQDIICQKICYILCRFDKKGIFVCRHVLEQRPDSDALEMNSS